MKNQKVCLNVSTTTIREFGKEKKRITSVISNMPKIITVLCNFILMDLKITFYFFYVHDQKSEKINNNRILESKYFLKIKIYQILFMLKKSYRKYFSKKKIPLKF